VVITGLGEVLKEIKKQSSDFSKGVDKAVVVTANEIRRDAVLSINKQSRGTKRVKSRKNKKKWHYVSPEGQAPNSDTNTLVRSIDVSHIRGSKEAIVFSTLEYAAYLEFVLNRPWLEPASAGKDEVLKLNILKFTAEALR
jgi:hypothetical protein